MQTLWSRARTATNSCRCSLCNPPRATVPRRATGGAPVARRRHGVNDAITIFYGTVIAAALFTDASSKIGRRVRLDRELEKTKQENERLERGNRERLRKLGWEGKEVELKEREENAEEEGTVVQREDISRRKTQLTVEDDDYGAQESDLDIRKEWHSSVRYESLDERRPNGEGAALVDRHRYLGGHKKLMKNMAHDFLRGVAEESRHTEFSIDALITSINDRRDPGVINAVKERYLAQLDDQLTELLKDANALEHELLSSLSRSAMFGEDPDEVRSSSQLDEQIKLLRRNIDYCSKWLDKAADLETQRKRRAAITRQSARLAKLLHIRDQNEQASKAPSNERTVAEQDLSAQQETIERLRDDISNLKNVARNTRNSSDKTDIENQVSERIAQLTHERLKFQDAIDNLTAYTSPKLEEATAPAPKISTEAWPVGRTPEEIWNIQFMDKGSHYWRKRRSHVVSAMLCQLIKKGMEANKDFSVDLHCSELHPLHPTNISMEYVNAELKTQQKLMRRMADLVDDRGHAIEHVPHTSFPKYKPHGRASTDLELGKDQRSCNWLCNLMANSQDSWQTVGKICEVLAGANSPPTIQIFNILLVNLPRIGLPQLCPIILGGLMGCGLTPNEVTTAAFLQSASYMKSYRSFTSWAEQIDVAGGKGFCHFSPASYDLLASDLRVLTDHFWERRAGSEDPYVITTSDEDRDRHPLTKDTKRLLRQPLNKQMYEALICGYYRMGQHHKAQRLTLRMEASGFGLTANILNASLREQLHRPRRRNVIRSLYEFLDGLCPGSQAELTESVYLFFQTLSRLWGLYLEKHPRASEESSEYRKYLGYFRKLNSFALEKQFIEMPLESKHFVALLSHERETVDLQLDLIMQLSTPVLHLRFEPNSVQSLTEPCSAPLWGNLQPRSLQEFASERLAILHQDFVQRHGTLPSLDLSSGIVLGGEVAVAAERQAEYWRCQRLKPQSMNPRRWARRNLSGSKKRSGPYSAGLLSVRPRRASPGKRRVSLRSVLQASRARKRWKQLLEKSRSDGEKPLEAPNGPPEPSRSDPLPYAPVPEQSHDAFQYFRGHKMVADIALGSRRVIARTSIEFR